MSSTNRSERIWMLIDGFPNYKVSNDGRVINIKTNYILKPSPRKEYLRVFLYNEYGRSTKSIHRLVGEAFIPNYDNLPQINHKDCNKQNNCVENLEWCNNSHNQLHAWENGLQHRTDKHKKQIQKLTEDNKKRRLLTNEEVLFIRENYIKGKTSYQHFANMFNVSGKTIEYIVKHIRYKEVV